MRSWSFVNLRYVILKISLSSMADVINKVIYDSGFGCNVYPFRKGQQKYYYIIGKQKPMMLFSFFLSPR